MKWYQLLVDLADLGLVLLELLEFLSFFLDLVEEPFDVATPRQLQAEPAGSSEPSHGSASEWEAGSSMSQASVSRIISSPWPRLPSEHRPAPGRQADRSP